MEQARIDGCLHDLHPASCGTCKYWGKPRPKDNLESFQAMNAAEGEYKLCGFIDMNEDANKPKAFVEDGSNYYAALKTKDDFACNCWEAKGGAS